MSDVFLNTAIITLARIFFKDTKAGMSIYLFANLLNLMISYFKTDEVVFFEPNILIITTGFTLSTVLYFTSMYMNMSSTSFNNYYSLKILTVSVFSIILLRTKYRNLQWLGKFLIACGIITQFISDKNLDFSYAIFTAMLSGIFNAFSTVMFEYKIKDRLTSIWRYLFTFNFCYVPFNLLCAILEYRQYQNENAFLMVPFYILVFLNVFALQMSVYLSMKVDSFERTIISVVCNMISSILSDILLEFKFDLFSIISFVLVFSGTMIYICFKVGTEDIKKSKNKTCK
ncbi:hypothetical protein P3W45_000306 [Vairimorpha bombi]